jgi:hypothetical protein
MIVTNENLTTEKIVQHLIKGDTISIIDSNQREKVRKQLREIKKNCTIVLSQLKNL